jgi:site-specific recombinase XerC
MTERDRLRYVTKQLEYEVRTSEIIIKNLERDIQNTMNFREQHRLNTMKEREEHTLARFRSALEVAKEGVNIRVG